MSPATQFKDNLNTGTLPPAFEKARLAGLTAEVTGKGSMKAMHKLIADSSSEAEADDLCGFSKTGSPVKPTGLTAKALAAWNSLYQGKNFDMNALVSDSFGKKLK